MPSDYNQESITMYIHNDPECLEIKLNTAKYARGQRDNERKQEKNSK